MNYEHTNEPYIYFKDIKDISTLHHQHEQNMWKTLTLTDLESDINYNNSGLYKCDLVNSFLK